MTIYDNQTITIRNIYEKGASAISKGTKKSIKAPLFQFIHQVLNRLMTEICISRRIIYCDV